MPGLQNLVYNPYFRAYESIFTGTEALIIHIFHVCVQGRHARISRPKRIKCFEIRLSLLMVCFISSSLLILFIYFFTVIIDCESVTTLMVDSSVTNF